MMGQFSTRMAFKVARVSSGDAIIGLLDTEKMPASKFIDFDRYNKMYTVKIGDDILWKEPSDVITGTMCKQADDYAEVVIKKAWAETLALIEKRREENRIKNGAMKEEKDTSENTENIDF